MTSNQLKALAIITMVIDHVGYVLFPDAILLRIIGRIAFPIFAFLISEGYYHTRNINKYMVRLGIFALVSEIPFDLAFHGKFLEFHGQNVFFTLLLGLLAIRAYHYFEDRTKILGALSVFIMCLISFILKTDYYVFGVLIIFFFDRLRGNYPLKMGVSSLLLALLTLVIAGSKGDFTLTGTYQIFSLIGLGFIHLYNGQAGRKIPGLKLALYVFYPLHLMVIYLIH